MMPDREVNMGHLSRALRKLTDDETISADEMYELIVLTIDESIQSHREAMNKARTLRDKLTMNKNNYTYSTYIPDLHLNTDKNTDYWNRDTLSDL